MTRAVTELTPRFDALDPAVLNDPYPIYARLRSQSPVCRAGAGQWAITRYDDAAALLTDSRLRNAFPPAYYVAAHGAGPTAEFVQRILLYSDRPRHKQLRTLLGRSFEPGYLRGLRGKVGEIVTSLLRPAFERGRFDAVADLAIPLPINVVCELLGIPACDWDQVRPKALELGKAFSPIMTPDTRSAANEAVSWLRDYVAGFLRERIANPRDDLLSRMVGVNKAGLEIGMDEMLDNAVFLFFAGFETTTSLLSTAFALLLSHPEAWQRLRVDRSLVAPALEEFLRWDAPIQSRLRLVQETVEVGGRILRPGRLVLILLGSANRDQRRFERPDQVDVSRHPNPHLSFGAGDHYCLGAALARMEAGIVLEQILERCSALEPGGAAVRNRASPFRAFERVPVVLRMSA